MQRLVRGYGIVTGAACAETQRKILKYAGAFNPGFIGQVPLERHRGEESPLVVGGKVGGGVGSACEGDVIALFVIVVCAGKEGYFLDLLVAGGERVIVLVADCAEVVPHELVHQHALSHDVLLIGKLIVHGHAGHGIKVMCAGNVGLISHGVVGVQLDKVCIGPVHLASSAGEFAHKIMEGKFSDAMREQFVRIIDYYGQDPYIIRSSSILEDGFGNAFADMVKQWGQ